MYNFSCPKDGCTKKFRLRDAYQKHVKVCQTGVHCPECGKFFESVVGKDLHVKAVHENIQFGCGCGKQYSRKAALYKHVKTCMSARIGH